MAREKEFNQRKYQQEYNKKNYDRMEILMKKGKKEEIKEAAKTAKQSVSEYVMQAVNDRMDRDAESTEKKE